MTSGSFSSSRAQNDELDTFQLTRNPCLSDTVVEDRKKRDWSNLDSLRRIAPGSMPLNGGNDHAADLLFFGSAGCNGCRGIAVRFHAGGCTTAQGSAFLPNANDRQPAKEPLEEPAALPGNPVLKPFAYEGPESPKFLPFSRKEWPDEKPHDFEWKAPPLEGDKGLPIDLPNALRLVNSPLARYCHCRAAGGVGPCPVRFRQVHLAADHSDGAAISPPQRHQ